MSGPSFFSQQNRNETIQPGIPTHSHLEMLQHQPQIQTVNKLSEIAKKFFYVHFG